MIQKPGEFAPGQRYRPGMLQRLADGVRGATPVRQAGVSRHRTRLGWTQDDVDASPGGIVLGVITIDLAARSGVYPNFTLGAGSAEIMAWIPGSPTVVDYVTTVYNPFEVVIPASTRLVKFGLHESGALIFINRDC